MLGPLRPDGSGWDGEYAIIAATAIGASRSRLLKLILYSNGWFSGCETPKQFARAARAAVEEGHRAIKLDLFRRGYA
jgi:L-alanine-DL-glutamate epimerase-like enolase superfamily enzyme